MKYGRDFVFLIDRHQFIDLHQKEQEKPKGNDELFCHKALVGELTCTQHSSQLAHTMSRAAVQVWRELSAVLHAISHIRKLNQAEIKAEAKVSIYSEGKHNIFIYFS